MNIYVHKDGNNHGPYSLDQLRQYVQQGTFTPQDPACHDGQNWVTIAQVPGIASNPANPAPQTAKTSVTPNQQATATEGANSQSIGTQTNSSGRSKKWMLYSGIGIAVLAIITGVLLLFFQVMRIRKNKKNWHPKQIKPKKKTDFISEEHKRYSHS